MPVAKAGKTSAAIALSGAAHPASGNPCEGSNPISPMPFENSRINSKPPHSAGIAPATIAAAWNTPRSRTLRVNTAAHPSGSPIASAISRLSTISGKVTEAREDTCADTALPLTTEVPRSPCSKPSTQSPYCAAYDLSSPICARSDVNRSAVALVPATTAATSPGRIRSSANTSSDNPTNAPTNSRSRLPRNLMICLFHHFKSQRVSVTNGRPACATRGREAIAP